MTHKLSGTWAVLHENGGYKTPAAQFPGDENVSDVQYAACMDKVFAGTMAWSFSSQAEGFGIAMTPERHERSKRMLALSGHFDTWLDDGGSNPGRFNQYIRVAGSATPLSTAQAEGVTDSKLLAAIELWENSAASLASDERCYIRRMSVNLGELSLAKSSAVTLGQYRFLAYGEGWRAGHLWAFALCAGTPKPSCQSRASFSNWLGEVSAIATLVDSGLDLASDYEAGRTHVRPTLPARLSLVAAGLGAVTDLLSPQVRAALRARPVKGLGFLRELF